MKLNRFNGLLARIANRMESARLAEVHAAVCASVDPSATLHPTASIENLCRDPNSIVIGAHTHVRGQLLTFWNGGSIRIGKWCYVGEASRIWSQAAISIGDHVMIAHAVDIHDTDSHPLDWEERRRDSEAILSGRYHLPTQTLSEAITIEDDAWIGYKASILKGVRIGRAAIVAAGAVVTRNVDPATVVAGNPARVVASLENRFS